MTLKNLDQRAFKFATNGQQSQKTAHENLNVENHVNGKQYAQLKKRLPTELQQMLVVCRYSIESYMKYQLWTQFWDSTVILENW